MWLCAGAALSAASTGSRQVDLQEMSSLRRLERPVAAFAGLLLVLQCVQGLKMQPLIQH